MWARFVVAALVSVMIHAALVVGTSAALRSSSVASKSVDEAVQLDVTSVDLSFSEEENEQAAPSVAQPAVAASPEPPAPPPPQAQIPEPPPLVVPPEPDAVAIRSADEVHPTELRPQELEAPESPRIESNPPKTEEKPVPQAEPKPVATHPVAPVQPAVAAPAPTQARVDAPPQAKRSIKPKYPEGARTRGEEGDVVLELEVGARGVVEKIRVVGGCGFAELEQAAMAAARKAVFRPAKRDGKPVSARAWLTLKFRLRK